MTFVMLAVQGGQFENRLFSQANCNVLTFFLLANALYIALIV